jgi:hypothetical protein
MKNAFCGWRSYLSRSVDLSGVNAISQARLISVFKLTNNIQWSLAGVSDFEKRIWLQVFLLAFWAQIEVLSD